VSEPLRRGGVWRKRWTYIAAFAEDVMVCAARVEVGPIGQTFWAILDRGTGELHERTRIRLPGRRGEVRGDATRLEIASPVAAGSLEVGAGAAVEVTCPTAAGGYVWTRKQAGVPVAGELRAGDRRWRLDARGVVDETAGYHPHRTAWSWSAGVGRAVDGRSIGWNLVEGINDPVHGSERAIWIDGEPSEPAPVGFDGLAAIEFPTGERLVFTAEAERRREQNALVVRYRYRQPFGTFAGTLPGGIELERGLGVVEHHEAVW
jgi:uncharacterized protein DUF2804